MIDVPTHSIYSPFFCFEMINLDLRHKKRRIKKTVMIKWKSCIWEIKWFISTVAWPFISVSSALYRLTKKKYDLALCQGKVRIGSMRSVGELVSGFRYPSSPAPFWNSIILALLLFSLFLWIEVTVIKRHTTKAYWRTRPIGSREDLSLSYQSGVYFELSAIIRSFIANRYYVYEHNKEEVLIK